MDQNRQWIQDMRINKTIEAMKKNNINGYHVKSKEDLIAILDGLVDDGDTVSVGGSMTLFETGTIEYLRSRPLNFLDRYETGLPPEAIKAIYFQAFAADVYLTSSNAVTESGGLYNVDGIGNRVAAMIYGPEKVLVIVGSNKIVKDLQGAIERNKSIAAPANARRLKRDTPCAKLGYCMSCKSKDKICHAYSYIESQMNPDRMHVIIIDETYGY